jgi:hypothetical protein
MNKDNKKLIAHMDEPIYDDIEDFEGKSYKSSLTNETIEELTDFEGKTIYETIDMCKKIREYITSDFEILEEYFYSSISMLKDTNKIMKKNYFIMRLAALKYTILLDEELAKEYLKIAALALKNIEENKKDSELLSKLEIYLKALKERNITYFGQDFLDILAYITDKVTLSFDNFNKVCDNLSIRLQGINSSSPKNIDEIYEEKNEKIDAIIKKLGIK